MLPRKTICERCQKDTPIMYSWTLKDDLCLGCFDDVVKIAQRELSHAAAEYSQKYPHGKSEENLPEALRKIDRTKELGALYDRINSHYATPRDVLTDFILLLMLFAKEDSELAKPH